MLMNFSIFKFELLLIFVFYINKLMRALFSLVSGYIGYDKSYIISIKWFWLELGVIYE